jgi:hypothetical protein
MIKKVKIEQNSREGKGVVRRGVREETAWFHDSDDAVLRERNERWTNTCSVSGKNILNPLLQK